LCRYGFACPHALDQFKSQPAAFIAASRQQLLQQPHLIPALGFMDPSLPRFVAEIAELKYEAIKCNFGTQTPTHFVEQHVDHRCSPVSTCIFMAFDITRPEY
jgi:hypothetical protein